MPGGGGHDGGPALLLGHIKQFEPRRGADGIGHLPAFVLEHVGDDHFCTFTREQARRGCPHPGCRAGDDGDLARESHCWCHPQYLTVILMAEPNFVLGQQATFSHEFEAHNVPSDLKVAR